MPQDSHPLERRSNALAQALKERVDLLATMMRPDGRPIFHQRLNDQKALEFWQKHRFDDLGKQVMVGWTPDQVMALDQRLMAAQQSEGTPP